jgi:hypothetical protein
MSTRNKYATAEAMLIGVIPAPGISQYRLRRTTGAVWIERFMHILRETAGATPPAY